MTDGTIIRLYRGNTPCETAMACQSVEADDYLTFAGNMYQATGTGAATMLSQNLLMPSQALEPLDDTEEVDPPDGDDPAC